MGRKCDIFFTESAFLMMIFTIDKALKHKDNGFVRLQIWKMHPDNLTRCFIQMLHMGVVRLCILSMDLDLSSENNYVHLFFFYLNLLLHVTKMTKIDLFSQFWQKITFVQFWQKICICGFDKNVFLAESAFLWFWRKNEFLRFWPKNSFLRFWRKNAFYGFGQKCVLWFWRKVHSNVFDEKCVFTFLNVFCYFDGKCVWRFWAKSEFLHFWRESKFCSFDGKSVLQFWQKKSFLIFWPKGEFLWFGGIMRF